MQQHFPAADLHRLNFTTSETERTVVQEEAGVLGRPRAPGWWEASLGAPWPGRARAHWGEQWRERGRGPARSLRLPARCWPRSFLWQRLAQAIFMLCEKASPSASWGNAAWRGKVN